MQRKYQMNMVENVEAYETDSGESTQETMKEKHSKILQVEKYSLSNIKEKCQGNSFELCQMYDSYICYLATVYEITL